MNKKKELVIRYGVIGFERKECYSGQTAYKTEEEAQKEADELSKMAKGEVLYEVEEWVGTKEEFGEKE